MSRRVMVVAIFLIALAAMPLAAQHPAGSTTYRVSLVLYPGDDAAALARQLAGMYRGKLEEAEDDNGTFTIALTETTAAMMARDPRVESVQNLASVPMPVTGDRIRTEAVTQWTLGNYAYDGSGNIKTIGTDAFVYDSRNRLIRGDAGTGHKQEYTYDGFGNIKTIVTDAPGSILASQTSPYKTSVAVNPKTNVPSTRGPKRASRTRSTR